MAARSLSPREERMLVRQLRKHSPRDHALVSAQLWLGFRVSEILALTVGHVTYDGRIRERVALPPRFLKGGYGGTRSVPVSQELRRALERYLGERARGETLDPAAPLFLSSHRDVDGRRKAICLSSAEKIVKRILIQVAGDPQGLSTHALRKSFGQRVYEKSGHDLLLVRDALGHSSVAVTQRYLPTNRQRVDEMISASDWSRRSKKVVEESTRPKVVPVAPPPEQQQRSRTEKETLPATKPAEITEGLLPGFEGFAA